MGGALTVSQMLQMNQFLRLLGLISEARDSQRPGHDTTLLKSHRADTVTQAVTTTPQESTCGADGLGLMSSQCDQSLSLPGC